MNQEIITKYQVFSNATDLIPEYQDLIIKARKNTFRAYAPYSKFFVGAVLLLDDGNIINGSNHENAAYPMCLCAEQVAIANFHTFRDKQNIKAIAITARTDNKVIDSPVPPCGACRQILLEVADKLHCDFEVILQGEVGPVYLIPNVKSLLPIQFNGTNL